MKVAVLAIALLTCTVPAASAQDYKGIEDFAQSICGDIPEGSYTKTTIEGKVGANAGILTKIITGSADLDVKHQQEVVKGIPFDKLPNNIPTVAMCKSELAKIILQRATINTCRLKDFGQQGWNRTENYANSSDWIGGGHDQGWWCNQVANQFIASRKINSDSTWEKVTSGEESHKDTWGHVTYKYSCTVKVSWDPLYFEKQDARCGTTKP